MKEYVLISLSFCETFNLLAHGMWIQKHNIHKTNVLKKASSAIDGTYLRK